MDATYGGKAVIFPGETFFFGKWTCGFCMFLSSLYASKEGPRAQKKM